MCEPEGDKMVVDMGFTITPSKASKLDVHFNIRLQAAQDNIPMLSELFYDLKIAEDAEFGVDFVHVAVELGEKDSQPHNQMAGRFVTARSASDVATYLEFLTCMRDAIGFKSGAGAANRRVPDLKMMFAPRHIYKAPGTEYAMGYTYKDRREEHYRECEAGIDDEKRKKFIEIYENNSAERFNKGNKKGHNYNPRNNDSAGKLHLITKTNFVDGSMAFTLRSCKQGDVNRNLYTVFKPTTVCATKWWIESGRATLAPSWVTTYGRGDANEAKLELLRETAICPASARDIQPIRYLMLSASVPPALVDHGHDLLYRPRILGPADEHEQLSLKEAMHVVETGEYPSFIVLQRQCKAHKSPRGHVLALDLSVGFGKTAATDLLRSIHAKKYNIIPRVYDEANEPDALGIVSCGLIGMVQAEYDSKPLKEVTVSKMTRMLSSAVRYAAMEYLRHENVYIDDGLRSVPIMMEANQCAPECTFGPLSPSELTAKMDELEAAAESSVVAQRTTYAAIVRFDPPPPPPDDDVPISLDPLVVDDVGTPMRDKPTPPAEKPHHFAVVWRYRHEVVSQVLRRVQLTPFADGQIPRPEFDVASRGGRVYEWRADGGANVQFRTPAIPPDTIPQQEEWEAAGLGEMESWEDQNTLPTGRGVDAQALWQQARARRMSAASLEAELVRRQSEKDELQRQEDEAFFTRDEGSMQPCSDDEEHM